MSRTSPVVLVLVVLSLLVGGAALAEEAGGAPPDFELKQLDGEPIALSTHLKKDVVVLSFWATWCAPCGDEMKQLQVLHGKYGKDGLVVLGVNVEDASKEADVRAQVKERGVTYPILLDPDTSTFKQFNARRNLPFFLIIGRDGVIATKHAGFKPGDEVALEAEVRGLLGLKGD
jgi:peroxiredoxin